MARQEFTCVLFVCCVKITFYKNVIIQCTQHLCILNFSSPLKVVFKWCRRKKMLYHMIFPFKRYCKQRLFFFLFLFFTWHVLGKLLITWLLFLRNVADERYITWLLSVNEVADGIFITWLQSKPISQISVNILNHLLVTGYLPWMRHYQQHTVAD